MRLWTFLGVSLILFTAFQVICSLVEDKIVDGYDVNIEEYPFVVQVNRNNWQVCGGSLVSTKYVVSAGHCFFKKGSASNYTVRAGSSYRNRGGVKKQVSSIAVHPDYDSKFLLNDIAMLELSDQYVLGDEISVVNLPPRKCGDGTYNGLYGTVVGWGRESENGNPSVNLKAVSTPILFTTVCESVIPSFESPIEICGGNLLKGGVNACYGDSGGPLLIEGLLVGIISNSQTGCAKPRNPEVFTNVNCFVEFIRAHIIE